MYPILLQRAADWLDTPDNDNAVRRSCPADNDNAVASRLAVESLMRFVVTGRALRVAR